MTSPEEIVPGVIFYSYLSAERKEKVCFWKHHTLILQVSGQFTLETSEQTIFMKGGEMLLIGKNQVGTLIKTPLPGINYETIVISLQEDLLRKIELEEKLETDQKFIGLPNVLIPSNEFLQGYFQSIVPYARNSGASMTDEMDILKVKEGVKLLMLALPELRNFLFDFSEHFKMNLEKFMLSNFHFNIPIEKFAYLTGFKRDFKKLLDYRPANGYRISALTKQNILLKSSIKSHQPSILIWALKACRTFSIPSGKSLAFHLLNLIILLLQKNNSSVL